MWQHEETELLGSGYSKPLETRASWESSGQARAFQGRWACWIRRMHLPGVEYSMSRGAWEPLLKCSLTQLPWALSSRPELG